MAKTEHISQAIRLVHLRILYTYFLLIFAAIAGALYVNLNNSISPTEMSITFSVGMVIWVAVGGRGSLVGAVIGAILVSSS
ncbi:MAG: ABC transporter permease subunit [Lachnospirales bacterium]